MISLAFCPNSNNFPSLYYSLISLVTIWLHILILDFLRLQRNAPSVLASVSSLVLTIILRKTIKILTVVGFSLRYWTTSWRKSFCEILLPVTRWSCSESAINIQFPAPLLCETVKPLSRAMLSKFDGRSVVLIDSFVAWSIFRSATKVRPPVIIVKRNYSIWYSVRFGASKCQSMDNRKTQSFYYPWLERVIPSSNP